MTGLEQKQSMAEEKIKSIEVKIYLTTFNVFMNEIHTLSILLFFTDSKNLSREKYEGGRR